MRPQIRIAPCGSMQAIGGVDIIGVGDIIEAPTPKASNGNILNRNSVPADAAHEKMPAGSADVVVRPAATINGGRLRGRSRVQ